MTLDNTNYSGNIAVWDILQPYYSPAIDKLYPYKVMKDNPLDQ